MAWQSNRSSRSTRSCPRKTSIAPWLMRPKACTRRAWFRWLRKAVLVRIKVDEDLPRPRGARVCHLSARGYPHGSQAGILRQISVIAGLDDLLVAVKVCAATRGDPTEPSTRSGEGRGLGREGGPAGEVGPTPSSPPPPGGLTGGDERGRWSCRRASSLRWRDASRHVHDAESHGRLLDPGSDAGDAHRLQRGRLLVGHS